MSCDEQEMNEFRTEAFELLETAEKSLLALEGGDEFANHFNAIFRVFHNLKGACGMLGLDELGKHMHALENRLNSAKDSGLLSKDEIDLFLSGIDRARALLIDQPQHAGDAVKHESSVGASITQTSTVESSQVAVPPEAIAEFVSEAQEALQRVSTVLQSCSKQEPEPQKIGALFRDIHTIKGGAYLFALVELGELAHAMESTLDLLRQGEIRFSEPILKALVKGCDLIDRFTSQASLSERDERLLEEMQKSTNCFNLAMSSAAALRMNSSAQVNTSEASTATTVASSIAPPPSAASSTNSSPGASEVDREASSTIRVPVPLLDKLMTLMGEMVLVRNQVIQYSNRTDDLEFLNLSQRLNVITSEIQGEMMKTRMQPIGNVLNKFSRLVRELQNDLGKKIELQLSGTETELDKTLLEAVKDPLTHIVRNSCDHGIELPAERLAARKPEAGTIHLRAYHEGGQVIIEIKDDGRGLHRDKLLKKAIEKGIIREDRVATLSDRDIVNLIFAPGFSTAAQVTNVSGRGVGMDVVRTNIERIGGSVEVQSEAGLGTTMRLKIPLTLAIVPAMIVRSGEEFFAIPQLKLVELVRVDQNNANDKIEFIQGNPIYRLRGQILPLLTIQKVLGLEESGQIQNDVSNIVVLKSDHCSFGLIVDEVQDTADIVVKPLARFLKPISVYSGATVLGDGSIALILDVAGIVKEHILSADSRESSRNQIESNLARKVNEDLQDFLLFKTSGSAKHGILLSYVHRLEEFRRDQIEISNHQRVVRYRNAVLPLISVDRALGLVEASTSIESGLPNALVPVVVIERAGFYYGLEVVEILDVLTTAAPLDLSIATSGGVMGNLVTDQEIVVVLDPYRLIPVREVTSLKPDANVNKRVLYVEDAAFFRSHIRRVLERAGFQVTTANHGEDALALLSSKEREFDIVLSDIEMPVLNGFGLAERIRKNPHLQSLPLVALSTKFDQRHIDTGLKAGFNAYLEKLNGDELVETLRNLTKRSAA